MKRKLIALAVAGAFVPAIAMADTSVTIYGTMNGAWNYIKADGATTLFLTPTIVAQGANQSGRSRVDIDSSNIGFRVKEDLGGGLGAWGQCEISMNFDSGGGSVCTRNAGVGLEGGFGNIFLGQWDSPYKQQGAIDVMGNTHIVSWVAIMSSPGLNTASTTGGNGTGTAPGSVTSFDRRQQNTVNYYTPNWNGFQIKLQASADEEKPADALPGATLAQIAAADRDPFMYAASIGYDNGPFYANFAYEKHEDFGANPLLGIVQPGGFFTGSDDDAWRVALGYKFGNFRITGAYEELTYESSGIDATGTVPATGNIDRKAWYVGASYAAGPHYFALSYADADNLDCSGTAAATILAQTVCNDTGANMYAARYAYSLSKRTEVFAHYIKVKNDQFGQYTFGVNTLSNVAPGADPEGFGVGVKHKF